MGDLRSLETQAAANKQGTINISFYSCWGHWVLGTRQKLRTVGPSDGDTCWGHRVLRTRHILRAIGSSGSHNVPESLFDLGVGCTPSRRKKRDEQHALEMRTDCLRNSICDRTRSTRELKGFRRQNQIIALPIYGEWRLWQVCDVARLRGCHGNIFQYIQTILKKVK